MKIYSFKTLKRIILTFILFFPFVILYAQNNDIIIKGVIIESASREPVIGANIIVENTTIGTVTDYDGNYSLSIPANSKNVVISSLGMKTIKLPFSIDKVNTFRLIEMSEDEQVISEVVVVGFGKQKKESVIGAIQTLKPQELAVPSSSLTSAFAGKIAGVIAVQRSGEPGADGANFWIRGISTFAGPTNPLIVMDGVEITASDLNAIAPESIESFSILKDATATALYGAKGANGVMVVTTKSGKDMDKPRINLRAEYFMSKPTQLPSFVDGVTYMKLYNQAANDRNQGVALYPEDKIIGTEAGLSSYLYPNVDWYNLMFKDLSQNQSVNLNVMGGSKKIDYFINASVFNETGMYQNSPINSMKNNIEQKRFAFQNNINAQLTPSTKIGLRINSQIREHDGPGYSSQFLFTKANQISPVEFPAYYPSYDDVNHIMFGNISNNNVGNPLAYLLSRQRNELETNVITSFNIEQKLDFLTKGLSVRGLASFQGWSKKSTCFGYDPFFYELSSYDSETLEYTLKSVGNPGTEDLRVIEDWRGVNSTINYQFAFDYDRTFHKDHNVSAMLLYHQREYRTPSSNIYETLPFRDQGLAGRATYNYNSRYFTEFNFGYNGSENFKKGMRFGFFPSVALGYLISSEEFFSPMLSVISMLKIRGSYGLVGNSFTDPRFPYITEVKLNSGNYSYAFGENWNNSLNGVQITKYGQESATWETGKKMNVGVEIGLFDKLTVIADIFKEDRSGIFMQRRMVPSTVGIGSSLPYANIGRVENKGGDMSVDFNHAFRHDFIINIKGNLTYSVNKLIDKDEPNQLYPYQSEIGQPIGRPFGLISLGLYTKDDIAAIEAGTQAKPAFSSEVKEGDIKYQDLNGDMIIDDFDRTYFGNPSVPSLVYGFGASVKYKRFDASIFFQGVGKTTIMMDAHPFGNYKNQMYDFIANNHWSTDNPNPNALYPRLSATDNKHNTEKSSFWAKNGSFLRLKNAEIGYSWKGMRAYVSGTNLFTFSKFKYWDPEIGSGAGLAYPPLQVFNIGVQMTIN